MSAQDNEETIVSDKGKQEAPVDKLLNNEQKEESSPIINSMEWGSISVEGYQDFKDVKIYPGGAESWDWSKNDTHHVPGILPDDVQELLNRQCEIIILSRGMQKKLQTSPDTVALLRNNHMKKDKDYFIVHSEEAMELYNKYAKKKKRVGALIHSTC